MSGPQAQAEDDDAGTEGDVERLTPAAQVLAATMIYSQPAIKKVIGNATTMLQDGAWIGPSLRPTAPQLVYAGTSVRDVVTAVGSGYDRQPWFPASPAPPTSAPRTTGPPTVLRAASPGG